MMIVYDIRDNFGYTIDRTTSLKHAKQLAKNVYPYGGHYVVKEVNIIKWLYAYFLRFM